ncbi:MAG: hypothetical protein HYW50_03270 [Candidatus Diapherotrites archaeon]|nr:hypothetical protein [Candidatus Diapherotrites archaeon]
MDPTQEFIEFVLNHPGYYHISRSKIFLDILKFLSQGAQTSTNVYKKFVSIDQKDVDDILETLSIIGLLKKHFLPAGLIFSATLDAKTLLEKIEKSKKQLLIQ